MTVYIQNMPARIGRIISTFGALFSLYLLINVATACTKTGKITSTAKPSTATVATGNSMTVDPKEENHITTENVSIKVPPNTFDQVVNLEVQARAEHPSPDSSLYQKINELTITTTTIDGALVKTGAKNLQIEVALAVEFEHSELEVVIFDPESLKVVLVIEKGDLQIETKNGQTYITTETTYASANYIIAIPSQTLDDALSAVESEMSSVEADISALKDIADGRLASLQIDVSYLEQKIANLSPEEQGLYTTKITNFVDRLSNIVTTATAGDPNDTTSDSGSSAAIDNSAKKFVIETPSRAAVGSSAIVTIKAISQSGNVDTAYEKDVSLVLSGNGTGAGLVDIRSGVGTKSIGNTQGQMVNISLNDTSNTELDVSDTKSIQFLPVLLINDQSFDELGIASVYLSLNAPSDQEITFDYTVGSGTASENVDFLPIALDSLTLPAGATSASIPLGIVSDRDFESGGETTIIGLPNSESIFMGSNSATVTINDDDLPRLGGVESIALGYDHTCALLSSGAVKCWGDNAIGQIGDNTTGNTRPSPTDVAGLSSGVSQIVAKGGHTCVVLDTGPLRCWGDNWQGQVGDNTSGNNRLTPTDVSGLSSGVSQIATGAIHTCALLDSGAVKCWGYNWQGQVGDNTSGNNRLTPTDVSGLSSGVSQIAMGSHHTCALLDSGAVKCWGYNGSGQIGDNTSGNERLTPTDVSGLSSGVSQISGGTSHTCALLDSGAVKCWGDNAWGQIGDNTSGNTRLTPTDVSGLSSGVDHIAVGDYHACALLDSGAVKCWGNNGSGQVGDSTSGNFRLIPADVSGLSSAVTQIAVGGSHTCALLDSGYMQCWGSNGWGQMGNHTTGNTRLTPTDVTGLSSGVGHISTAFREGMINSSYTCALLDSGAVKCWGNNMYGQMGDNTTGGHRMTPTEVLGLSSGVSQVGAGAKHACALLDSGAVKCWGDNGSGQVGDNTSGNSRPTPTEVSGLNSGASQIAVGAAHTCALFDSGAVKCWGDNWAGQVGDSTSGNLRLTPTDVLGLGASTSQIAVGNSHTCALLTSGAVKCWGDNWVGQIGDNSSENTRLTPTEVSGLSSGVRQIIAGDAHTCALLTSGAVKCWGANGLGQIGDNTSGNTRLTPTEVSGLSSGVSQISAGYIHTCALLESGAVKCWGTNGSGQIGDNTSGNTRLTPTDVFGLSSGVRQIAAGVNHTCATDVFGRAMCWGANSSNQLGNVFSTVTPQYVREGN